MAVWLLLSASFLVVTMIFFISDFLPFSQSRLSNQFLTCEDGSELISLMTWAWVWRGIGIVDAFIIPSTVYTWEGYGNRSVSFVCVSVCLCVST